MNFNKRFYLSFILKEFLVLEDVIYYSENY